jgi:hypothetical protein
MKTILSLSFLSLLLVVGCAQRNDDNNTPGGSDPSAATTWVMRSCGATCVEFNPAYLQCALSGTCASLTDAGQINALITAAPSEARLVGECAAVTPTVTGWSASGSVQAPMHKDASTGWYRVDGGVHGVSNSTCNVSFMAVGCQAGDSHCWQQSGTAPLSDLNSHTGGPGMYCVLDNQGHSTGCALEWFLDSNGNVALTGQLPNGP